MRRRFSAVFTGALYPWSLELCACVQVYGPKTKNVQQAWHEPTITYINTSLLLYYVNHGTEGIDGILA